MRFNGSSDALVGPYSQDVGWSQNKDVRQQCLKGPNHFDKALVAMEIGTKIQPTAAGVLVRRMLFASRVGHALRRRHNLGGQKTCCDGRRSKGGWSKKKGLKIAQPLSVNSSALRDRTIYIQDYSGERDFFLVGASPSYQGSCRGVVEMEGRGSTV